MPDAAAEADEARRVEARGAQEHARAQGEERGRAVRLLPDDAGHGERPVADDECVAEREAEPGEDGLLDHGPSAGEELVERPTGCRLDPAVEGIAGVDGLELDEEGSAASGARAPSPPARARGRRRRRGARGPGPAPPRRRRAGGPSAARRHPRGGRAPRARASGRARQPRSGRPREPRLRGRCTRGSRRSDATRLASPARPGPGRGARAGRAASLTRPGSRGRAISHDAPVPELHDPVGEGREGGVVGHQHERDAVAAVEADEEIDDLAAGRGVEVAGRLVGQQESADRSPRRARGRLAAARRPTAPRGSGPRAP